MHPFRRPILGRSLLLAALAVLVAPKAHAHDQTYPVAGDSILLQSDQQIFQFEASGPEVPTLDHDPTVDGTAILVRGVGANAGRTANVTLDRNLWAATATGFEYSDPNGTRGGITHVVLEPGLLSIQAGAGFGWSPGGAQDEVWVHMRIGDTGLCSRFTSGEASSNAAGTFSASGATAPAACPAQVCGDGIPQAPEACDDGNLATGDGCEATCETGPCNAQSYATTFEAIQGVIFEGGYGCSDGLCHDSVAPKNDLELTHAVAYESLLGPDGQGKASYKYPDLKLVERGAPELSLLYIKLAAKTFPNLSFVVDPGTSMPSGSSPALSQDHLLAVWKWIREGAPREGVVPDTQALLGTCLPPPTPLKIPPPPPPAPGTGVQLLQTPWDLAPTTPTSQGEDEICMATYYDVSQLVPDWAKVPCPDYLQPVQACAGDLSRTCTSDGDCAVGDTCTAFVKNANNYVGGDNCFVYDRSLLLQDPQSHHSIIQLYTGAYLPDDPNSWNGAWTRKLEPDDPDYAMHDGEECDPWAIDAATTGTNHGCSSPVVSGIACGGFGPPDMQFSLTGQGGGTLVNFSGSQEPYFDQSFADGVYATLPLAGIVVWNSHAFNLTPTPSTMAQYLNLEFAPPENQRYPVQGIFDAQWIFAQNVPPFGTEEICATYTIPQHAHLYELSSHTHLRGVGWRTWGPPNTPCQPGCPAPYKEIPAAFGGFKLCSNDLTLPICEGPRPDPPLYYSNQYSDPLQLDFDPPRVYDSPNVEDRTFLYCSLYDNGSTDSSPPVKSYANTPMPPGIFGFPGEILNQYGIGGPCPADKVVCSDGPNKGAACGSGTTIDATDHAVCGDPALALCDACPARGGVTTQDEMFILLGSYYIPEPETSALGAVVLGTLAWLARRRRA